MKYNLGESLKVGGLVCQGLRKHYFCLNIDPGQQEDDRDIDQLLDFIQGGDRKEQDKKKNPAYR